MSPSVVEEDNGNEHYDINF